MDLRPFLKWETGIGVYFKNLLFALSRIDDRNKYFLFSSSLKDRFSPDKIPCFARMCFRDFHFPVKAIDLLWYKFHQPSFDFFFNRRMDLTHSPTPLILPTSGKKIVTVHDLFFLDFPDLADQDARKKFVKKTRQSLLKADGIIAVSHYVKRQIVEKSLQNESRIKVIYHGANPEFCKDMSLERLNELCKKFMLPEEFIFFVGTSEPRKNLVNLVKALAKIHKEYKPLTLVVAGRRGDDYNSLIAEIKENRLSSWVRFLFYLPFEEVRALYRMASLLVIPSFCEGFGLPLLEAMGSELPIAASGVSALPEIGGEAAVYFDPHDPEDMADKIIHVLQDKELRHRLVAKGKKRVQDFAWEKTAVETLAFYHSVVGSL